MSRSWYAYIYGDPLDAQNYAKLTIQHGCLCGDRICAIYSYGIGIQPVSPLSLNIQNYISNALITGQLQPEIPFDSKKYVYLRI